MKTLFELGADMSKTDIRELENRLTVLIEHLLKIAQEAIPRYNVSSHQPVLN